MKKIIPGLVGLMAAVVVLPLFSAFEAHVVNVTATIENALYVHPASRVFGTVFPQEYLEQGVFVTFSQSFSDEDQTRVGNVDYKIVQKPKPLESFEQQVGVDEARKWCHDNYPQSPFDQDDDDWEDYLNNCYPSLCPFLSKTPDNHPGPGNDIGVLPFHDPFATSSIAYGTIDKFSVDVGDTWTVDLAVPCFEEHCAQDWASFVDSLNPFADPNEYKLPIELEHEVFGCDLWIEVTKIY